MHEALGNKASQTWVVPAGSRRQCLAQDSAGMIRGKTVIRDPQSTREREGSDVRGST